MTHIGGFFELESAGINNLNIHDGATSLHTGRACIVLVILETSPQRVYLPHYSCNSLLEPFIQENINVVFYEVNEKLFPIDLPSLKEREYLIYINYFGICDEHIRNLESIYGEQLIVDDTQAFFKGKRQKLWSFTSARKHFGIPDGAYLHSPQRICKEHDAFEDYKTDHLLLRKNGKQREAFAEFQRYEDSLNTEVYAISEYSKEKLASIDFKFCGQSRINNYQQLHKALGTMNTLQAPLDLYNTVPFCYPFMPAYDLKHSELHARNIYSPVMWNDVIQRGAPNWECNLSSGLLPLPIDHRYEAETMKIIIDAVIK